MSSTLSLSVCDPSPWSADHLCDDCSNMGNEIRQLCEKRGSEISKPVASVERNRSTCAFCGVISASLRLKPGDIVGELVIYYNKPRWRSSRSDSHYDTNGIDQLVVLRKGRGANFIDVLTTEGENLFLLLSDRERCLGLTVDTGSAPAIAKHISGRCIKPASNLDQAKDWLNDCISNHNHNQVRAATRPSLLVAVGTADGSASIRIVDGSDADKAYLAVSYRWGGETLLTTTATFEPFHTSIPWKQLPQTFQDAIQVARELSIRYMWIDSLCIIQDSLADWETESAKMADIYKGALLTIMAASASDSQGGFFGDRVVMKGSVALPYTDANGATEFSVFVHEALPSFYDSTRTGAFPLFQRGWVFQERLMSTRKLIFGEDQKYWECDGVVLSESNIRSRSHFAHGRMKINAAFRIFSNPLSKEADMDGPASPRVLWKNLVEDYSECALTYQTDRLPALSGLARTFAQQFGGSYAAGLWQDQMPCNLMWCPLNQSSREINKGEYYAPSWSWASVKGAVQLSTHGGKCELDVLSINIKLAGQDPYGRVCPGSNMCVRGRLHTGKLVALEGCDHITCLKVQHGDVTSQVWLDRSDEHRPIEVTCLEVMSDRSDKGWEGSCLLLCGTGEDKHFRRVGIASLRMFHRDEDYLFHGLQREVITIV